MMIAICLLMVAAADPASIAGTWNVTGDIAGNPVSPICKMEQSGAQLTGTCTTDKDPAKMTGAVTDEKITWKYDVDYQGSPLTLEFTGKLRADGGMEGSVEVPSMGASGSFTAKKE